MAFKMKNPFKQVPTFVGLGSIKNIEESVTQEVPDDVIELSKKRSACLKNSNTEWKDGKCVPKKIVIKKGASKRGLDMA